MSCTENSVRTFHTGFYSKEALSIMKCLHNDLKLTHARCKNTARMYGVKCSEIKLADDNEVIIDVKSEYYWRPAPFSGWTDAKVLDLLAWMWKEALLKKVPSEERSSAWNRGSVLDVTIFPGKKSVTIADYYFIYDKLRMRKNAERRFPKALVERLIGQPLDPIMVELKTAQKQEIADIKRDLAQQLADLDSHFYRKLDDLRNKIALEKSEKKHKLEADAAAKIANIEKQMAELQNISTAA